MPHLDVILDIPGTGGEYLRKLLAKLATEQGRLFLYLPDRDCNDHLQGMLADHSRCIVMGPRVQVYDWPGWSFAYHAFMRPPYDRIQAVYAARERSIPADDPLEPGADDFLEWSGLTLSDLMTCSDTSDFSLGLVDLCDTLALRLDSPSRRPLEIDMDFDCYAQSGSAAAWIDEHYRGELDLWDSYLDMTLPC